MQTIHKVKQPFMSWLGQFQEGERSLCIGVKVDALRSKQYHLVQLSNKVYRIDCAKALALAQEKNAFFKGDVAVVPILLVSEVRDDTPREA